ncbi:MAG: hypothetical protein IPL26_27815 [Leptospiraceae bacterium]|nr:hypothetical protein [Leptospiraceae bacterium]
MVKFALFLLTAISIKAEYSIDMITANKRMIQDRIEKGKTITAESRTSDNIIAAHGKFLGQKKQFEYNIHLTLTNRFNDKDYKDILYLGENCYLSLPIQKFNIVFGRKRFDFDSNIKSNWRDGLEGVGIDTQISNEFRFSAYLVDFYRGYPLFENFFLFKNKDENIQNGERFRHGLSLTYRKADLFSRIQFTYLNLGNWGNGTKDDFRSQPIGDRDFIYTGSWNISNKSRYFIVGLEIQIVRGLDKTQSNSNRKEKSLPISGELVRLYFESYFKFFQTKFEIFLPDSDKQNLQGEVLESGYIGFGSYPGKAFLLNQELNFYPSGWVTPSGLEKMDSFYSGRRNSFWSNLLFSAKLDDIHLILEGDYLIPRRNDGAATGSISFERRDYTKSFLFELTSSIFYDKRNSDGFFIRFNLSKLYTSKDILLDGTSVFLQGGVIF